MRDVQNRHRNLPQRTPEMLYNVVRKFYRGAVSHFDLIQEKKQEARAALEAGDHDKIRAAVHTLFLEFHFYVTCWLQIELALYRLARQDESLAQVMERYRPSLEKHVAVRQLLDQTEACVEAQFQPTGDEWSCVQNDAYVFGSIIFTVDEESLQDLHAVYQAIWEHADC